MTQLVDQPTKHPTRKVTVGALAGAVSVIVVWVVSESTGLEVPPAVASAFTVLVTFAFSYVFRDNAI